MGRIVADWGQPVTICVIGVIRVPKCWSFVGEATSRRIEPENPVGERE